MAASAVSYTHLDVYKRQAQRQGTTKEYEAAYKKAILYFDDGLAELKGKADEYGKAKVSSQPKEISAIDYEGKKEAARDRARKEHEVTETKSSMIQKSVPQMVKKLNKMCIRDSPIALNTC